MDIDLEHYKIFYYVAKYRSFTKAANALYANQPNITRTVKTLENELGCTLFDRSKRLVRLTPEGEKLYAHIKIAIEHIRAGEEELATDKSLQSGSVSIGATENTLHYVLLPVLKDFRQRYPAIAVKVSNHNTAQAVDALKNGLVDLAIVTSPVHLPTSLKSVCVKHFREVAVCSSRFNAPTETPLTLKQLCAYPLVSLNAGTMTYEFYTQYFLRNGAILNPEIEVATTDQILSMVKNDLGIGFVPDFFLSETSRNALRVLEIAPPIPERTICLIERTDRPLSIAAKELERLILLTKN